MIYCDTNVSGMPWKVALLPCGDVAQTTLEAQIWPLNLSLRPGQTEFAASVLGASNMRLAINIPTAPIDRALG